MGPQNQIIESRTAQGWRVKGPDFKVQHGRTYWLPGFEGFFGGSWWEVEIVEQRDDYSLAKYLSNNAESTESWLPLDHLRLRSRKADSPVLDRRIDISVSGILSDDDENLGLHPSALYDARIIQISRVFHDMNCTTNVSVLQPVNLTFEEILRSHMLANRLPIKWVNDAFFLREAKLMLGDGGGDGATGTLLVYEQKYCRRQ